MSSINKKELENAKVEATNKFSNFPLLPTKYRIAVDKLFIQIKKSNTLSQIRKLLNEFSTHFTMIPELWKLWLNLEAITFFPDFIFDEKLKHQKNIIMMSKNHFIFDIEIEDFKILPSNHQPFDMQSNRFPCQSLEEQKKLEKALCFPHKNLKYFGKWMKATSIRPIPQKILKNHEKALLLDPIKPNQRNYPKWMEFLESLDDRLFLIDLVEFKLGNEPTNLSLWTAYLNCFKKLNDIKVLNAYSRCLRIFTDNSEMEKEYLEEIRKFGNLSFDVTKFWVDIILFECKFSTIKNSKALLNEAMEKFQTDELKSFAAMFDKHQSDADFYQNFKLNKSNNEVENLLASLEISPNFPTYKTFKNTIKQQCFSFPAPIIRYISALNSSSFEIKQKLFETCKYFYDKYGKRLCHRFYLDDDFGRQKTYICQSLNLNSQKMNSMNFNNLIVTNIFGLNSFKENITSLLLKKQIQINAKYVLIENQILTQQELLFLKSSKLYSATFYDVTISDTDDPSIKTLVETFMDVIALNISYSDYHPDASESLAKIKSNPLNRKLKLFKIRNINETFLIEPFLKFIKNNFSPTQENSISVTFARTVFMDYIKNFETLLKEGLKSLTFLICVKYV